MKEILSDLLRPGVNNFAEYLNFERHPAFDRIFYVGHIIQK
jgi:hypothetical protein